MIFQKHSNLEGKHAILSASSWRWINDDPESITKRLCGQYATVIGTVLHSVAYKYIRHRIKMHKYDRKNVMLELLTKGVPGFIIDSINFDSMFETLMTYVNDCIGFKMSPEVVLYYSDNFFGTADAIGYSESNRILRISDYKSGSISAHIEQLMIYAALFCLEYRIKPSEIDLIELKIYQSNEVIYHNPEDEEIEMISNQIIKLDKFLINMIRQEG